MSETTNKLPKLPSSSCISMPPSTMSNQNKNNSTVCVIEHCCKNTLELQWWCCSNVTSAFLIPPRLLIKPFLKLLKTFCITIRILYTVYTQIPTIHTQSNTHTTVLFVFFSLLTCLSGAKLLFKLVDCCSATRKELCSLCLNKAVLGAHEMCQTLQLVLKDLVELDAHAQYTCTITHT